MVEILPFGKYKGKSVEQVCLNDYHYFSWLVNQAEKGEIYKQSLRQRILFVYEKANKFKSKKPCVICDKPARFISVYATKYGVNSNTNYIYCSGECFRNDPKVTDELYKIWFLPLEMDSLLIIDPRPTKSEMRNLMSIIKTCMGLENKRYSKEQLYEFFNRLSVWGELF